ncbi:hypothetical protein ACFVT2_20705 [Streptomyces sp. NPDC058000]
MTTTATPCGDYPELSGEKMFSTNAGSPTTSSSSPATGTGRWHSWPS